ITALGEERAFVVGHDWGGVVAWDFAMSYPEALRGLAVLNLPHPQRMAKGLTTLRQIRKSWYVFAFQLPVVPERAIARDDFAVIRKMMGWALKRRPDAAAEVERYVDAMRAPGAVTGPVNYYRAAIRYAAANMRRWRRIAVPVLVIWGEKDPALGAELAAPSARWVPHARVERLPDANHFVQLDAPDRVNRLLVEYLDGRRAEGA
ncbi:MAG TPA: alpha/beta hydrolase, partial [Minicystis sp.]|nr:alpha/beta hydrolase [Minicystis sp.]